jgi:hypothetical protein
MIFHGKRIVVWERGAWAARVCAGTQTGSRGQEIVARQQHGHDAIRVQRPLHPPTDTQSCTIVIPLLRLRFEHSHLDVPSQLSRTFFRVQY